MKRIFVSAFTAITLLTSGGFAEESDVDITDISAKRGLVSVEAVNNLRNDTTFTFTVIKNDESLSEIEKTYAVKMQNVKANEKTTFMFRISDERAGISGSGIYNLKVRNLEGGYDEEIYIYADTTSINKLIEELKNVAETVSDPNEAYTVLADVILAPENNSVIYGIGFNLDEFVAETEEIQHEALNLLYNDGIHELTVNNIGEAFAGAYGLSVYNDGDSERGIDVSGFRYADEKISDSMLKSVLKLMDNSYGSIDDFENSFMESYGIETIKNAKVEDIEDVLLIFSEETGECSGIIDKIIALPSRKKADVYDEIVLSVDSGSVTNAAQLEDILESAYYDAKDSVTGGGGASGSGSNRVSTKGTSVSMASGSAVADVKSETVYIFTDLSDEHWAASAVLWLKNKGIVNGTDTGAFEPDRNITREEFTKMLIIACEAESATAETEFVDLEEGAWYIPYINAAVKEGIVNGIGDNMFGVGQNITRQDMAVMAERAINNIGIELANVRTYTGFKDSNQIADYAAGGVKSLYEKGIISGKNDNVFDPLGNATRAEAAKIIYEAFKGGI